MIMRIKELREKAKMSQKVLAEQMCVLQSCVSNWENEVALPRARQLPELAKVLGCEINELFADEGSDTAER